MPGPQDCLSMSSQDSYEWMDLGCGTRSSNKKQIFFLMQQLIRSISGVHEYYIEILKQFHHFQRSRWCEPLCRLREQKGLKGS